MVTTSPIRDSPAWALARAARCRALLADEGQSDDHFEIALALHGQTADAFETGCTYLAYGARLRRERQRVRSREQLRAALDVFDHLGAEPWSEMARARRAHREGHHRLAARPDSPGPRRRPGQHANPARATAATRPQALPPEPVTTELIHALAGLAVALAGT